SSPLRPVRAARKLTRSSNSPDTPRRAPMSTAVTPEPAKHELHVVKNASCTFCGCVCDDIQLHATAERIVETKRACILGESWFKTHSAARRRPDARIDGREASVDEAVEPAADILWRANMPLVYGLSNTACEAQRQAVWLAELVGGVIDSHTSL